MGKEKDKMNFLYTSDYAVKTMLEKQGYQYITDCGNGMYVFVNNENIKKSYSMDLSKVHYTNVLCI